MMGFMSFLFSKKNKEKPNTSDPDSDSVSDYENEKPLESPSLHLKGKPDENGLYPSELVMLAIAEKYKTTETNYPSYITYKYEVVNPSKMLRELASRGFIKVGTSVDNLSNLKLVELKEIASSLGINVKGKKADIVLRLAEVEERVLASYVKERMWKLTEKGNRALASSPYISYFLERHSYNVEDVGVSIWTVNEEFVKNPKRPYRDIIYRQLNNRMNESANVFQKNPASGTAYTHRYCECFRIMSLFIEEEGKSYTNASDMYFQYLYKRINIHAGLQLLVSYKLYRDAKDHLSEIIERYYDEIQLYPYQKVELLRLVDELNIETTLVRESLITSFMRTNDSGIMTEKEAADFVIYELSGETDKSKDLAEKLAKKAIERIK